MIEDQKRKHENLPSEETHRTEQKHVTKSGSEQSVNNKKNRKRKSLDSIGEDSQLKKKKFTDTNRQNLKKFPKGQKSPGQNNKAHIQTKNGWNKGVKNGIKKKKKVKKEA